MPTYDRERFDPPAPVARVDVRNPETGETAAAVLMVIDSGADATLLPRPVVDALEIPRLEQRYRLEAFDGTRSEGEAVRAQIGFLGRSFTGQFLVGEGDVGVLGRNVLNRVRVLLDGPAETWEEVPAKAP